MSTSRTEQNRARWAQAQQHRLGEIARAVALVEDMQDRLDSASAEEKKVILILLAKYDLLP